MMMGKLNMHGQNIQKPSILEKLAFANKGYLCSNSYEIALMSYFRALIFQKSFAL